MRIYIPHPFKKHDNWFNVNASPVFRFKPWFSKHLDEDIRTTYDHEVYDNYAGWLWFQMSWYSVK